MSDVALLNRMPISAPEASAGRLLGLTCFETMAFEDGAVVARPRHLDRLRESAGTLGLEPSGGFEAIEAAVDEALEATEHPEGIVRVSLHATGTPTGLAVADPGADVLVLVTAPRYDGLSEGVSAVTVDRRAPDPESWPTHVKAPSLARWLAHREARAQGAFEGLMLDRDGAVVSGTRSTVLARLEDGWVTPPAPPALPGVTRARLLEASGDDGAPITVTPLERAALDRAREIALAFTGPGVVPVTELDGSPVGDGDPGGGVEALAALLETGID